MKNKSGREIGREGGEEEGEKKIQVGVRELKDGEEEERRRHPCVLHLIRPPIEGYKLHQRERTYTQAGKHTL